MLEVRNVDDSDKDFWHTVSEANNEVKKWPDWMREITISATTASTGCFTQSSVQKQNVSQGQSK